jgi:hypothetical protein
MSRHSGDVGRYRDGAPAADAPVCLKAKWRAGPRTPAWDDLWNRLLVGLLADAGEPRALDGRDPVRSAES